MKTNSFISSPFIQTIVYGNIFIALCALSQVLLTYHLFPIPLNFENNSYLLFVLLSTYLQYNVQRGYSILSHHDSQSDRGQWVMKHKKIMLYSIIACLIIVLFLCNNLSYTSIGIMIGAEAISTLYYMQPFNLRRFGYIKPFLISMVWVMSCVLVPLIENDLLSKHSMWFIFSQFVFISVLCMLFDIKDNDKDYLEGVNTYANRFGEKTTKIICASLILFGFISFYIFNPYYLYTLLSIILRSILFITILITNEKRHAFYYYLWVDGLLILQTILFFLIDPIF
ncbi:MAG: UbiA family prenyltransferase [Bacteroidia bacterium]|nr:UbiA family prenyltransferase [Bacteroidia bacterium]